MADNRQVIRRPDEMPEHRAQIPRSSHDLGHDTTFTATCAHLMPVFYDFLNAGEEINLGFDFRLRTMPLDSAAMCSLAVHTEYFFVPMQLLYQPFSDWYYDISEQFSSLFFEEGTTAGQIEKKLPQLSITGVMQAASSGREYPGYESTNLRVARLFDMLDYPINELETASEDPDPDSPITGYSTFPYGLLAYNCIYQYFYRLDSREVFDPKTFNVDRFFSTGSISDFTTRINRCCTIKYRPVDNDYFTDIKVSPVVDVLNMNVENELAVAGSWLSRSTLTGSSGSLNVLRSGSVGVNGGTNNGATSPLSSINNPSSQIQSNFGFSALITTSVPGNGLDINTANIRAMFASEKLWSITGRAKKRYDDQTLAHFGYNVPHDVKHEITRFGHDVVPIEIGEVIATGASENVPLGEIAGKGYAGQRNHRHKFQAPCHGVVMMIMSIVPKINYYDYRSKYTVMRTRDDLYTPEYDHLGMQPLFGYEMGYSGDYVNSVAGWQYRYEQWKRRFNKVSLAFSPRGSKGSWQLSRQPHYFDDHEFDVANRQSYSRFVHYPWELNSIFVPQYNITWSESYEDNIAMIYDLDPFVISGHITAQLLSTMSDYSLPKLDA